MRLINAIQHSIDRIIEASTVQTAFGPIISKLRTESEGTEGGSRPNRWCNSHLSNTLASDREQVKPKNTGSSEVPPRRSRSANTEIDTHCNSAPNSSAQQDESANDDVEHSRVPSAMLTEPSPEPETFRNCFFRVKPSSTAGFGAFALSDIMRGQTILIEKALFHASNDRLYDEIDKLTPSMKEAFDRMHAHQPRVCNNGFKDRAAIFKTNRQVSALRS